MCQERPQGAPKLQIIGGHRAVKKLVGTLSNPRGGSYTRPSGIASVIGSMTVPIRTSLVQSGGTVLVSSLWVCNSGPNFLDTPNRGSWVTVDVTAANSQLATLQIVGEPLR